MNSDLDWDDIRFFLAASHSGSLAGAARRLKVSVATVGRRLDRLEEALGLRLFHRHAGGLRLTEHGQPLLDRAEAVSERMADFERAAAGSSSEEEGIVCVSTLETLATHVLVPHLAEFRRRHPGIDVILQSEMRLVRLAERHADIALRVIRPREERVVARKIATVRYGVFASEAYLAERGRPKDPLNDLAGHDAVTYDPRFEGIPEIAWFERREAPPHFALRVSSAAAIYQAVRSGCGLGILPTYVTGRGLVRLVEGEDLPQRDLWLAIHEDLRQSPRVRAVADYCANVVRRVVGPPV